MFIWNRVDWPEIEAFYKESGNHPFIGYEEIAKSSGMVTSDMIPDYRNPVYGAMIWRQLNLEANVFGAIPKLNWPMSGWRAQTAFSTDADHTVIGESNPIPDSVFPTLKAVRTNPKLSAIVFEISEVMQALYESSSDDIVAGMEVLKQNLGQEFNKMVNRQMVKRTIGREDTEMVSPDDAIYTKTYQGTDITVNQKVMIESLDRLVSSYNEVDAYTTDKTKNSVINIYNLERVKADGSQGTDSWSDAVVKYDVDGVELSDELFRQTIAEAEKRGAFSNVMITGYDTYAKILGLYINFARYDVLEKNVNVKFGMNGVETAEGIQAGIKISSVYGIPMIKAVDIPGETDTSKYLQRMFLLDTSDPENFGDARLGVSVLRPTEYFETRDFALLEKFALRGMYRIAGEVTSKFLPGQAKIRDILA
jgi:hypothetical protein